MIGPDVLRALQEAISLLSEAVEYLKEARVLLEPKRVSREARSRALELIIASNYRAKRACELLTNVFVKLLEGACDV